MNRKFFEQMFRLTFVVLWLIGCRVASAVQPVISTPGPETATPAVVLSTVQPVDKASPTDTAQSVPPPATTTEIHATKQPIADIRLEETGQLDDNTLALRTALAIHFGVAPEEIQFNISEQTQDHTKGGVAGGYFLAAREEGTWIIVYDGQATPGCAEIAPFEFPVDMVPECLDGTNNLVVRAIDGRAPAKEAEASITIVGTAMNVSLSARIIMLQEPVQGFSVVALTQESELFSPDGDEITLRNIGPGVRIEASGMPGDSAALLASRVRLLP